MHTVSLAFTLFTAGVLTILLPCILPLVPIVVGVSVAGKSKLRPLLTVLGMVTGFVVFNFAIFLLLRSFPSVATIIRDLTFYALFLFGVGFVLHDRTTQLVLAVIGGVLLMMNQSVPVLFGSIIFGIIAVLVGGIVANRIQQFGTVIQTDVRSTLGNENSLTALIMGLTLGLVWVPCAGPALAFALTLVREEPGVRAFVLLLIYAIGAGLPLLLVGYGGQYAVHSVRKLAPYTGLVKKIAGVVLIFMAFALKYDWITSAQTYVAENTSYGKFATDFEEKLFTKESTNSSSPSSPSSSNKPTMTKSSLPRLSRAPEFASPGPWLNSEPLKMADLKGKVVLVDFWTYSCINCIRTLPYIEGYWDKYKDSNFVLVGVHTPEFVFEQETDNVKAALKKYGLTYPVVQDNDFGTWNAFANRYWPAKYLIDAEGYIRYEHFGEGNYEETDEAIASLLAEIGAKGKDMPVPEEPSAGAGQRSPETYVGSRSWPALANAKGNPSPEEVTYKAPETLALHKYALDGTWQLSGDGEYQQLQSASGEVRMHFQGSEINLVLGLAEGVKKIPAEVWIDGKKVKDFDVTMHDLYQLYKGSAGEHELILKLKGKGVEAYAFTFG
jgi:cytochrome c biogenesis protein CcdA/thiol-disulfide isomerase/thioredoxin